MQVFEPVRVEEGRGERGVSPPSSSPPFGAGEHGGWDTSSNAYLSRPNRVVEIGAHTPTTRPQARMFKLMPASSAFIEGVCQPQVHLSMAFKLMTASSVFSEVVGRELPLGTNKYSSQASHPSCSPDLRGCRAWGMGHELKYLHVKTYRVSQRSRA